MKSIKLFSLAVVILLSMNAMAQGGTSETLTWELSNDGTLTIGGTGIINPNGPWTTYKDKIKSIVIGDGITAFGPGLFHFGYYPELTSVYIGSGFKDMIGCYPFEQCLKLTTLVVDETNPYWATESGMLLNKAKTELWDCAKGIQGHLNIPSTVIEVGNMAFRFCEKLTSITIPQSVKSIGFGSFSYCKKLAEITIPNSVTTIGDYAFMGCDTLTEITIPNSVVSIGTYPFSYCDMLMSINVDTDNPNYSSNDGILYNKLQTKLINCPAGKKGSVIIPNSVTTIGAAAFSGCYKLTGSLIIPNSVIVIEDAAFEQCRGLTELILGNSVTKIGDYAFNAWDGLTGTVTIPASVTSIGERVFEAYNDLMAINVDADNSNYSSNDGVLYNKLQSILISCPAGKKTVTIPNTVTTIGKFAFSLCSKLEGTLIIPNSVIKIEERAFQACSNITEIIISNTTTTIGSFAFWCCVGLTSLTIPNSVTTIGDWAFQNCNGLTDVYVFWKIPQRIETNTFAYINVQDVKLHIPKGTLSAYQNATVWKDFGTIIEQNQTVVVDEGTPAGSNGTGTIEVSLEIPSNVPFTGTFKVALPNGMSIDVNATKLADGLGTNLVLTITQNSDGSWLFTITSTALRSSMDLVYQKIADIVYKVDKSVSDGTYKATINDLNLNFDDGTSIVESELPVSITVDHSYTGIPSVSAEVKAYVSNNVLYIDSPTSEIIRLYSVSGSLLYNTKKPAGKVAIPLNGIQDKVLIIRSSSGWVKKAVK